MERHQVYSCCDLQLSFNPQCDNTWTINQSVNISFYCSCSMFAFSHLVLVASVQSNSMQCCTALWHSSTTVHTLFSWFLPELCTGYFGVQHLPPSMCPHWTWCDEAEPMCGCEPHLSVLWSRSPTVLTWLPMAFCLVVTLTISCYLFIPPYLSQFWMFILTRPFLDSGQKAFQVLKKT